MSREHGCCVRIIDIIVIANTTCVTATVFFLEILKSRGNSFRLMLTRCWVEDHWINDQRANPVTSTTIHLVLFEARFIAIKHLFIRTASTTTSAETIIIISIPTVIRATLLTAWLFVPLLCALLMVMVLLLFDWCYRMVIFLFKD